MVSLRRGTRLGKYRLDKRLGRGSFAEVWKARDSVEQRYVALKIALPEMIHEYERKELEREARIAAQLSHPNVVAVRNADWNDGHFVIATDLAECNLAEYPGARRSARIALQVIRDSAAGLAHAHSKRVMHRDVKPENILIFADRRAAIADFGVSTFARGATSAYTEAGTLGYMAPEQAYGRPKLTSDVFSLGLIAYEILTGQLPTWPFEWPPPRHDRFVERVPLPVQAVLRKAANFDPDRRYPDAVVFHEALEEAFRRVERERNKKTRRRKKPVRKPSPTPLQVEAELFRKRHGRGLKLRFRCHRCDGPISEAMAVCPWCGSKDNSFREITRQPLFCPECERGLKPEWTACPWCYPGRLQGNGRPPRFDPEAERSCTARGCKGQLQPFMRYCPQCKRKPRRPWTHPDLPDRCPRCRWAVSRQSWRFCPWCGRREPHAGTFGNAQRRR
jgi:serine/threonine-protein kinase